MPETNSVAGQRDRNVREQKFSEQTFFTTYHARRKSVSQVLFRRGMIQGKTKGQQLKGKIVS